MENIKYIIFDMDDTLLTSDKKVTTYTLSVLKTLQNLGHKIVINTARTKSFNQEYFDLIKPDYAILNGGSLIIDKNENILFKKTISKDVINALTDELLTYASTFSIYTEDELFSSDSDYHSQGAIYFDFRNNKLNKESLKIVASFYDQEVAKNLASKYDLVYVPYLTGRFGRINRKDTSKESGNRELMKLVGSSLKDTIVFGDDIGDLNMINEAGIGILMKNAREEMKSKVKNISQYSNSEEGVAKFLVNYFNIKI